MTCVNPEARSSSSRPGCQLLPSKDGGKAGCTDRPAPPDPDAGAPLDCARPVLRPGSVHCNGQEAAHDVPDDVRRCSPPSRPPEGAKCRNASGIRCTGGPVTTHHVREDRVFRPFLPVRAWLAISAAFLLATVVLGFTVGVDAGGPAYLGFLVAIYIVWRSTYRWRTWNESVAARRVAAAKAADDDRDREMFRQWLRQQARQEGPRCSLTRRHSHFQFEPIVHRSPARRGAVKRHHSSAAAADGSEPCRRPHFSRRGDAVVAVDERASVVLVLIELPCQLMAPAAITLMIVVTTRVRGRVVSQRQRGTPPFDALPPRTAFDPRPGA
jgi:hypothetical protein